MNKGSRQIFTGLIIFYFIFFIAGVFHVGYKFYKGMPNYNLGEQYNELKKNNIFHFGYFLDIYLLFFRTWLFVKIFGFSLLFLKKREFFCDLFLKLKKIFFISESFDGESEAIVFTCIFTITNTVLFFIKGGFKNTKLMPEIGFPLSFFVIGCFNFFSIQFLFFFLQFFKAEKFYLIILGFLEIFIILFKFLNKAAATDSFSMYRIEKNRVPLKLYSDSIEKFVFNNGIDENVFFVKGSSRYLMLNDSGVNQYTIVVWNDNIRTNLILNLVVFYFLQFQRNFNLKINTFNFFIELFLKAFLLFFFYRKVLYSKDFKELFTYYGLYFIYMLNFYMVSWSVKSIFSFFQLCKIVNNIGQLGFSKDVSMGLVALCNGHGERVNYWTSPIFVLFGETFSNFSILELLMK